MAKKDMPQGVKDDWRTVYLCESLEQAEAVINYSYACRVCVNHDAMIVGDPGHCIHNRFYGSLEVSKVDALKHVRNIIDNKHMTSKEGHTLALQIYIVERVETNRYDYKNHKAKPDRTIRTCWIG